MGRDFIVPADSSIKEIVYVVTDPHNFIYAGRLKQKEQPKFVSSDTPEVSEYVYILAESGATKLTLSAKKSCKIRFVKVSARSGTVYIDETKNVNAGDTIYSSTASRIDNFIIYIY